MNKIDIRTSSATGVRLESLGYVTLGAFWNHILLSGDYWRLYHHDGGGAGVFVRGCKLEFAPDRCYLLAPACNLETWCDREPVQIFIHVEMDGCRGNPEVPLLELPPGFAAEEIAGLRRRIASGEANLPTVRLAALALAATALARLPEAMLSAPAMDKQVAAARGYINTHLPESISLKVLARHVGMSENSLLRLFRKESGGTPYQYLLQQRYHSAAQLLKSSGLSIEEICDAVGVRDRFHFSRRFKTMFGMAPGAYRRHYAGGVEKATGE